MRGEKGLRGITGIEGYVGLRREGDVIRVGRKPGVSGERRKRDPAFTRCRQNACEFGRVARYGKLLRMALGALWVRGADGSMPGRMTRGLMEVLALDRVNGRGERRMCDEHAGVLRGFELNKDRPLAAVLRVDVGMVMDNGRVGVVIPAFVPRDVLLCPDGATHYQLKVVGAVVDFEGVRYECEEAERAVLPIYDVVGDEMRLDVQLGGDAGLPVFLVMGVQFYGADGGRVGDGRFDAAAIVGVGKNGTLM